MGQLHKKFTYDQVKDLLARYLENKVKRVYLQEILGIKRRRFCQLVDKYKKNPAGFSIRDVREHQTRGIDDATETNIIKELHLEKKLILNKDVPIRRYNYRQIHSTTQEVPFYRLQRAMKEKISLFREFAVKQPYKSVKDIFSLRTERIVDPYRRISLKNLALTLNPPAIQ